ncbi:MAG: reverse transcriptase domain-containing protein [Bacteroidota bacterium]|nr:reverse transcriptase domain-containing protein [Bacteroidota bacterium]
MPFKRTDILPVFKRGTQIDDNKILALLKGYLNRFVYCGYYKEVRKGISLGCSLSPLMGAIYLSSLDETMQKLNVFYARFMDDWIIIAPTRWKLRKAIALTNQLLEKLRLKQHPDKTYIGKAIKGVNFLGFHINPYVIEIALSSIQSMLQNMVRLYEQNANNQRIGQYFKNWSKWYNMHLDREKCQHKIKTRVVTCWGCIGALETYLHRDRITEIELGSSSFSSWKVIS